MSKCKRTQSSLYEEAKRIAHFYFVALRVIKHGQTINDSNKITLDDYESYIMRVRLAYNQLDLVDQRIINNDFFYQEYPGWWVKTFSKSTYYRLRSRSIKNFVEAFNNA